MRTFLQAIISHAQQIKGNKGIALILVVLFWFGKTVVDGQIQSIAGEALKPVNDAIIRRLKPEVRKKVQAVASDAPAVDIRKVRIVAALNLQVRSAPRRDDSRVVARVSTPTAVLIVRQTKDWSLIQYRDDEAVIEGWVFSRYLSPLGL